MWRRFCSLQDHHVRDINVPRGLPVSLDHLLGAAVQSSWHSINYFVLSNVAFMMLLDP